MDEELTALDEQTRQQLTWTIIITVVLSLLVLALYRRVEVDRALNTIATGTPADRIEAVRTLVDKQKLMEALEDEPRWVQDHATAAAATIGTEQALFQLVAAKSVVDAPVAERIDTYLTTVGEAAIGPLVAALQDKDGAVRGGAGGPLKTIGAPTVSSLMPLIDVYDEAVRGLVSSTLGGIGEPAVEPLLRVMKQEEPGPDQGPAAFQRAKSAAEAAFKAMAEVALDPVINELVTHEDPQVRLAATGILGAIGAALEEPEEAARVVPPLVRRLQSDEVWAVRRRAAEALGGLEETAVEEGAVMPLIARLSDERSEVRAAAAEALGALGESVAAGPLARLLRTRRIGATAEIADALAKIGQPAIEPLRPALEHPEMEVRLVATQTIAAIGTSEAVVPLGKALQDAQVKVRRAAADALRNLADTRVLTQLGEALSDEESAVYYAARDALTRLGKPAVPVLLQALGNANPRVAYVAQQALARIGEAAIEPLVKNLRAGSAGTAHWSAIALGNMGEAAVEPTTGLLEDSAAPLGSRVEAARALGISGSQSATEPLMAAAQSAPAAVRRAAISALGEIDDERATTTLAQALTDEAMTVRDEAMAVLREWRLGSVDEKLQKLLTSEDENTARRAAIVLADHSPAASGELIRKIEATAEEHVGERAEVRKLLEETVSDTWAAGALRRYAIGGLSSVGTEASLDALAPLLSVGSDFAEPAAKAVGSIGQRVGEERTEAEIEAAAAEKRVGQATKLLLEVFDSAETEQLKLIAGSGLAIMGEEPVEPLIERLQESTEKERRAWAIAILGAIGKPATASLLDARGRAREDRELRGWLAAALTLVGDARAVDLLKQLPEEEQPEPAKIEAGRTVYAKLQKLL